MFNNHFKCFGTGPNLRLLNRSEVSSLDKWRLDELIILGFTDSLPQLPFNNIAIVCGEEEGFYVFSYLTFLEFADTLIILFMSWNKVSNITKLTM